MYRYAAFGLGIHSELLLPELMASEAEADVVVRLGTLAPSVLGAKPSPYCLRLTDEGVYLFWEEVGTLLIRGGSEIVMDTVPGFEESRLRLLLLGAAMGVILHQRGLLVLHASAVEVRDGAAIFLGGRGWGKSTVAAALHARGHRLLCDDVVAVHLDGVGATTVLPSFPQLKLWPDAVASLGEDPESLPRLSSRFEKRHREATNGFSNGPARLRHIFVLGKGSKLEIERLQPQRALMGLLGNLYVARFGSQLLHEDKASRLLQCAQVVRSVPIDRLNRPHSLHLVSPIAQLAQLVEHQLSSNAYRTTA